MSPEIPKPQCPNLLTAKDPKDREYDRDARLTEMIEEVEPSFPSIFKAERVMGLIRRGPARIVDLDDKLMAVQAFSKTAKKLAKLATEDLKFLASRIETIIEDHPWLKPSAKRANPSPSVGEDVLDDLYVRVVGAERYLTELEAAWPGRLAEIEIKNKSEPNVEGTEGSGLPELS
jgi:hypothetical protein